MRQIVAGLSVRNVRVIGYTIAHRACAIKFFFSVQKNPYLYVRIQVENKIILRPANLNGTQLENNNTQFKTKKSTEYILQYKINNTVTLKRKV